MNEYFSGSDDAEALDQQFKALMEATTFEKPTVASQQQYLEQTRQYLFGDLYEIGTIGRVLDSLPTGVIPVGDNGIRFYRGSAGDLNALVTIKQTRTTDADGTVTNIEQSKRLPITQVNHELGTDDVLGLFEPEDEIMLNEYFDGLDDDKRAGLLPDLDSTYEIFDKQTALKIMGDSAIRHTTQHMPDES